MRLLPILFNTQMVKAILEGKKTVTRRCVKLPKWIEKQNDGTYTMFAEGTCYEKQRFVDIAPYLNKPYRPGDILYVRETWSEWTGGYLYKAWTGPFHQPGQCSVMTWHPSLHMPKEAARIFLKVKDVRVERLQNMNEVDTAKEGIRTDIQTHRLDDPNFVENFGGIDKFKALWNSTIKKEDIGKYGWDANPWVWVVEFERCEKPEGV